MSLIKGLTIIHNDVNNYPNNVNSILNTDELDTSNNVVIFVGENGSGKTTLLNMIRDKLNIPKISKVSYESKNSNIELNYIKKPKGFYFKAEEFIEYISYINSTIENEKKEIERIKEYYGDDPKRQYAKMMELSPHYKEIMALQEMYSKPLDEISHGQAFLEFFSSRLRNNEIYLLDEPEMPLSFNNQLALLRIINEATKRGCQFFIITHSPVILSYPNATIYEACESGFVERFYEELDNVNSLRDFLNNKERYFRYLFD